MQLDMAGVAQALSDALWAIEEDNEDWYPGLAGILQDLAHDLTGEDIYIELDNAKDD